MQEEFLQIFFVKNVSSVCLADLDDPGETHATWTLYIHSNDRQKIGSFDPKLRVFADHTPKAWD